MEEYKKRAQEKYQKYTAAKELVNEKLKLENALKTWQEYQLQSYKNQGFNQDSLLFFLQDAPQDYASIQYMMDNKYEPRYTFFLSPTVFINLMQYYISTCINAQDLNGLLHELEVNASKQVIERVVMFHPNQIKVFQGLIDHRWNLVNPFQGVSALCSWVFLHVKIPQGNSIFQHLRELNEERNISSHWDLQNIKCIHSVKLPSSIMRQLANYESDATQPFFVIQLMGKNFTDFVLVQDYDLAPPDTLVVSESLVHLHHLAEHDSVAVRLVTLPRPCLVKNVLALELEYYRVSFSTGQENLGHSLEPEMMDLQKELENYKILSLGQRVIIWQGPMLFWAYKVLRLWNQNQHPVNVLNVYNCQVAISIVNQEKQCTLAEFCN